MTDHTAKSRSAGRGPRIHRVKLGDDGAWTCECGTVGATEDAADQHLRDKAVAAFARLDLNKAYATLIVSANRGESMSLFLLQGVGGWLSGPALRPFIEPGYDNWGNLSAHLRWADVGAALNAGTIEGDRQALLVLRIAVSLMGACEVNLGQLWKIPGGFAGGDRRRVREALAVQLEGDD